MTERVQDSLLLEEPHRRLRLANVLSTASTIDDVAWVVSRWASSAAAATFANLALFDPVANRVRVVHGPSLPSDVSRRWAEFPIDTPTPLCAAILTGHAVLLPDLAAIEGQYPLLLDDTIAAGLQATASLPLRSTDGSSVGALGLAWPDPQLFSPLQISHLQLVAELVSQAVTRAVRQPTSERRPRRQPGELPGLEAVNALQEALLARSFAPGDDLEVAAAYLPASDSRWAATGTTSSPSPTPPASSSATSPATASTPPPPWRS